jgi:ABC-type antimicrobial peptide transport system permease subunit
MALVGSGVALGLGGGVGLSRLVESLLFGVRGTDAVTLLLAAAMLLGVGAAAAYWPARRAASVDPITSLRYQ